VLVVLLHAPRDPFYSPKAARSCWSSIWKEIVAFCLWTHRTVSSARSPSFSGEADPYSHGLLGTLDSPVRPGDRWREPRVARWLRYQPLARAWLAHRIVRCTLDSPMNYSRGSPNFSRDQRVHCVRQPMHRTVWCTAGWCKSSWTYPNSSNPFSFDLTRFLALIGIC
jgi:hypothetical protein